MYVSLSLSLYIYIYIYIYIYDYIVTIYLPSIRRPTSVLGPSEGLTNILRMSCTSKLPRKKKPCHAKIGWCYLKGPIRRIEHMIKWNFSRQEYKLTITSIRWNALKKAIVYLSDSLSPEICSIRWWNFVKKLRERTALWNLNVIIMEITEEKALMLWRCYTDELFDDP